MPKLTRTDWLTQVRIFEAAGFAQQPKRGKGSHVVLAKPGVARPIVIPKYPEVGLDIIRGNMRTAGMSRERYFELLSSV